MSDTPNTEQQGAPPSPPEDVEGSQDPENPQMMGYIPDWYLLHVAKREAGMAQDHHLLMQNLRQMQDQLQATQTAHNDAMSKADLRVQGLLAEIRELQVEVRELQLQGKTSAKKKSGGKEVVNNAS